MVVVGYPREFLRYGVLLYVDTEKAVEAAENVESTGELAGERAEGATDIFFGCIRVLGLI